MVYMTNWYHLPYKNALDLIMVIGRSSVVTKIKAGKLIHMSIYTFGDVSISAIANKETIGHFSQDYPH